MSDHVVGPNEALDMLRQMAADVGSRSLREADDNGASWVHLGDLAHRLGVTKLRMQTLVYQLAGAELVEWDTEDYVTYVREAS